MQGPSTELPPHGQAVDDVIESKRPAHEISIPPAAFVTFDDLVDSHYRGPEEYGSFRDLFQSRYGRLERAFYGQKRMAVVLAVRENDAPQVDPQLFYRRPAELGPQFAQILFYADQIVVEARRRLDGHQLQFCLEMIYSAVEYLFRLVDLPSADEHEAALSSKSSPPRGPDQQAYSAVIRQLNAAKEYYERTAARRAVLTYLVGMFASVLVIGLAIVPIIYFSGRLLSQPIPTDPVLVGSCLAAGGLGAILSVMIRITKGEFSAVQDVPTIQIALIGAFRPLIGLISGVLIYFVISSGLIPLAIPQSTRAAWNFFVTVAFIAGFSERLIQDAIVRTEAQISTATSHSLTSSPAAPQAL